MIDRKSVSRSLMALAASTLFMANGTSMEIEIISRNKVVSTLSAGSPVGRKASGAQAMPHDKELKKQALGERSDALLIAQAYSEAFLACEPSSSKNISIYKDRDSLQTFIENSFFVTMDVPDKIILIPEVTQRGAIVNLADYSIITPQCPAGVNHIFWSASAQTVLFVTQSVSKVKTLPSNRELWTATYGKGDIVHVYAPSVGMRKLLSIDEEVVVDVLVPAADSIYMLTTKDYFSGNSPRKLLRALAGHPVSKSDIYLWQVGLDGRVLEKERLAKAIESGSARFKSKGDH